MKKYEYKIIGRYAKSRIHTCEVSIIDGKLIETEIYCEEDINEKAKEGFCIDKIVEDEDYIWFIMRKEIES